MRKQPLTREVPNWKTARTSGGQWLCPCILVLFLQPFVKNLLLSGARWRLWAWRDLYFNPVWPFLCSYGVGYVMSFHQPGVFLLYVFVDIDALLLKVIVRGIENKNWLLFLPWDSRISFKNKFFLALFSMWNLDVLCCSLSSEALIKSALNSLGHVYRWHQSIWTALPTHFTTAVVFLLITKGRSYISSLGRFLRCVGSEWLSSSW